MFRKWDHFNILVRLCLLAWILGSISSVYSFFLFPIAFLLSTFLGRWLTRKFNNNTTAWKDIKYILKCAIE